MERVVSDVTRANAIQKHVEQVKRKSLVQNLRL